MIEHRLLFARMAGKSTLMVREAMAVAKNMPGRSFKIVTPDGIFFLRYGKRQPAPVEKAAGEGAL